MPKKIQQLIGTDRSNKMCFFSSVSFKAQVALVGPYALNQPVAGSNPASK